MTAVSGRPKLVASGGGAIATLPDAVSPVSTILSAARSAMSDREPTLAEVMSAVRDSLDARDLFILCARSEVCGAGIEVTAFPVRQALHSLPANLSAEASTWGPAGPDAASGDVAVRVAVTDADLVVIVADRGRGFTTEDRQRATREHHLGLDILQRRIREYGGTLQVETSPGKGTKIVTRLPIDEVAS